MNIVHASTSPDLITRLKQTLDRAISADIGVGHLFISGLHTVAEAELA